MFWRKKDKEKKIQNPKPTKRSVEQSEAEKLEEEIDRYWESH